MSDRPGSEHPAIQAWREARRTAQVRDWSIPGDIDVAGDALVSALQEALKEEARAWESCEAMDAKLKALAPHGMCGCSYDTPNDLCMHHSPRLVQAEARIQALIKERDILRGALDGNVDELNSAREAAEARANLAEREEEETGRELDRAEQGRLIAEARLLQVEQERDALRGIVAQQADALNRPGTEVSSTVVVGRDTEKGETI